MSIHHIIPSEWAARDLWRVPGLLSLSRLVWAALFPFATGHPAWQLTLLAIAGATDVLDGWYARRFNEQSATGAALDAFTDKVFVLAVVVTLLATGALSLFETLLLGTRDVGELALAIRLRAFAAEDRKPISSTPTPTANVGGKLATLLQYVAVIAVILLSRHRETFIVAAGFAGVLATISYWRREARLRRKA